MSVAPSQPPNGEPKPSASQAPLAENLVNQLTSLTPVIGAQAAIYGVVYQSHLLKEFHLNHFVGHSLSDYFVTVFSVPGLLAFLVILDLMLICFFSFFGENQNLTRRVVLAVAAFFGTVLITVVALAVHSYEFIKEDLVFSFSKTMAKVFGDSSWVYALWAIGMLFCVLLGVFVWRQRRKGTDEIDREDLMKANWRAGMLAAILLCTFPVPLFFAEADKRLVLSNFQATLSSQTSQSSSGNLFIIELKNRDPIKDVVPISTNLIYTFFAQRKEVAKLELAEQVATLNAPTKSATAEPSDSLNQPSEASKKELVSMCDLTGVAIATDEILKVVPFQESEFMGPPETLSPNTPDAPDPYASLVSAIGELKQTQFKVDGAPPAAGNLVDFEPILQKLNELMNQGLTLQVEGAESGPINVRLEQLEGLESKPRFDANKLTPLLEQLVQLMEAIAKDKSQFTVIEQSFTDVKIKIEELREELGKFTSIDRRPENPVLKEVREKVTQAYRNRALDWYQKQRDATQALASLNLAVAAKQDDPALFYMRGLMRHLRGEELAAEEDLALGRRLELNMPAKDRAAVYAAFREDDRVWLQEKLTQISAVADRSPSEDSVR